MTSIIDSSTCDKSFPGSPERSKPFNSALTHYNYPNNQMVSFGKNKLSTYTHIISIFLDKFTGLHRYRPSSSSFKIISCLVLGLLEVAELVYITEIFHVSPSQVHFDQCWLTKHQSIMEKVRSKKICAENRVLKEP